MTDRKVTIVQGEYRTSGDPVVLLSTVLGSCVAVCLHDPVNRIGGMNHFLLPAGQQEDGGRSMRYGLFAMESLINALMKQGAKKAALQAKLFGGARMSTELRDIGQANATFARDFLATEGIHCVAESLGGRNARRVLYRPATGHASMLLVPAGDVTVQVAAPRRPVTGGAPEIELF
ncbi:MAG TPA: chemotaxis protein CheD [Tabrizicola sp.]